MKYKLKLHLFQCLFILLALSETNIFTQNQSPGPSPNSIFQPSFSGNDFQIGSRYFSQLTGIVTCQFGKTFLETCVITKAYYLSQNYPNPFNPTTTINFSIPKAGNVEMKVYDLTGKELLYWLMNSNQQETIRLIMMQAAWQAVYISINWKLITL